MSVDWPGRDEWYLPLFSDATLQELHSDSSIMTPLCEPVKADPDKWIPVVTRLVGGKNRTAHDNAVNCLIQFHLEDARKDALRPLIPWLSDPEWSRRRPFSSHPESGSC